MKQQKQTKPRRRWIGNVTIGKHRLKDGLFYFVDDRYGGRMAATPLEVALWRKVFGPIPYGPDKPARERMKRKKS